MRESTIETRLRDGVKALGGLALKLTIPGYAGYPDRMVLMPGGRIYFIELKRPGKLARKLQLKRHRTLKAFGFYCEVIDTETGVYTFLNRIFDDQERGESDG